MSNAKKKIMFLGGIPYIIPAIEAAHELGYYVITADYLPNNPAHQYADEYVNVSIIDKDAVLKVAREKQIDGVLSFAVDPGATTAAYVAEQMGLPNVGPYKSVEILQNKTLFRQFLAEHGFNVPAAKGYDSIEAALKDTDWLSWPMIVKPADGSGSKGVTKVERREDYQSALEVALQKSLGKKVIVEEFIEMSGYQSGSDSFSIDGELVYCTFDDQRFDSNAINPYTPASHAWPSTMSIDAQQYLHSELQRLLTLLKMGTALYNIEVRVGKNGKPYIMEVSPRAGGNRLAELLTLATGSDLVKASVAAAMGEDVKQYIHPVQYDGFWMVVVLHAEKAGIFRGIKVDDAIKTNIIRENLNVKPGDAVHGFDCATNTIGSFFMRFETKEDLGVFVAHQRDYIQVIVD